MGCDIHLMLEYDIYTREREWGRPVLPDRHPNIPFSDASSVVAFSEGEVLIPRDYALFGALAGVRAGNDFAPHIPPRGFPLIASRDAINKFFYYVVDGPSLEEPLRERDIPRDEAEDYVQRGVSFYRDHPLKARGEVSNPEWHTPSWLTAALAHAKLHESDVPIEFRLTLDVMRGLEHYYGVDRARIVFWFDN